MSFNETFINWNIASLCEEYDKICGANKNLARVVPDFIDGLKPVARRLLYIMYLKDQGKSFRKVAAISGDTIARIHMHGQTSVEDCLVGLTQWWNNNIPLIEGQGNFGSCAGDPAGASRYIQAKLSDYAYDCFFADWKESAVDMVMGADGETKEPLYLPAKYPNILLNGALGIGYGMGCNLPGFNFKELVEATISLMKNPEADILLIPDSPTGSDIVAGNFRKISDIGNGVYSMRCRYEICPEKNMIRIISLPYQVAVNTIREKIADIKERSGLPELIAMNDFSGNEVDLRLHVRDDVNPYKFMKKLIEEVGGLEKSYPVNITVTNDYESFDYSVKKLLTEWIKYRREQKRVVVNHKKTVLLAEQRTNDVKIFLMSENNLHITIEIFKSGRNRSDIELKLIERFRDSKIKMDSLQAKTLSEMRMHELSIDAYEKCVKRGTELIDEISEVEKILGEEHGIDKLIIGELREGIKKFGSPRKSNVVPYKISTATEAAGECILQLSSDGIILRKTATNVDEEPVPIDSNGFAVKVGNDCSFIAIDDDGYFSFIKVKDLPIDQEVPMNRFIQQRLGTIVALLPFDIDSEQCCTLISRQGILKKIKISEMRPYKRPCIDISKQDKLVKGIVTKIQTKKDILIYTKDGMGQRLDPNDLRVTSFTARGTNGFKLQANDEIIGCYSIDPGNQYLLYITVKGKMRLNQTQYFPIRDSKHDDMVRLITLSERDKLLKVVGCNRLDKIQVFFDDGDLEVVSVSSIKEGTMSSLPEKVTKKNAVSTNIVKVKIM